MGCGGSKPKPSNRHAGRRQQQAPPSIGAPQNVQIHIPRNRADEHGIPLQQITRDIDDHTLLTALNRVSGYIARNGSHIVVIAVGGAVNTLFLRSRSTTHDIDIFGSDLHNPQRILLDAAMQDAQQHYSGLGTDWLNTETQMWMPGPMHSELTAAAKKQDVKIYNGAGLTIYAAPWEYAFSAKINRIIAGGDQARPYDLEDAATYIHEYILHHGNRSVPVATALGWARRYNHQSNGQILRDRVNREYQRRYRMIAFV